MIESKRIGRSLFRAAASALALALIPASATLAADKVTITFANWAAAEGTTKPSIEQVIADFEKSHPDIQIKSEAISFSEIARQLALRVKAGNPPDVAQLAGNDTFVVAATGKLEPLTSYIGADLKVKLKPDALAGLQYQGQLIALPWTLAPAGFWYNKAVMAKAGLDPEKPPRTIEELTVAMAAIKKSQPDVIPLGLDTTNRPFSLQSNWPWMETFGATPIGPKGRADSSEMKRYLAWMRDLAKAGYIDPGRKIGEFRPLAAQDKIAFTWDQVLLQGVIQGANKMPDAEFYKHWGVTTQPAGPSRKSYSFEGGHQLVMFADSKQKKAAWEFMQYLAASADAIKTYTLGPGASIPPLSAAPSADLAAKLDTPVYKSFSANIVPTVSTPPFGPAFASASSGIMAGVQQAVTGTEPIDQIAASIQQQLERQ
ncbi:MAG TPA: extracellular solute-binding protein [Casimicrobiaceae bacterium]|jgi:multiple sugar transport system substrate-binding protein|nr:extracellular solute-binding protein [Casimicrobiaceae bacterium]